MPMQVEFRQCPVGSKIGVEFMGNMATFLRMEGSNAKLECDCQCEHIIPFTEHATVWILEVPKT